MQQEAKAAARALETTGQPKEAADALYAAVAITKPVVFDVGAQQWLGVLPGYGPLDDPEQFLTLYTAA